MFILDVLTEGEIKEICGQKHGAGQNAWLRVFYSEGTNFSAASVYIGFCLITIAV